MKNHKSIFVLKEVSAKGWRYPCRLERSSLLGYYSSRTKSETALQKYIDFQTKILEEDDEPDREESILGYQLFERSVDCGRNGCPYTISVCSYSSDGKILNESLTSNEEGVEFTGRDPKDIRFHPGDIVEVAMFGYAQLGIVQSSPPDKAYWEVKRKQNKYWFMDDTDDCYLVFFLGDGDTHEHPQCWQVFPPSKPVSKTLEKKLQDKLTEMQIQYGYTVKDL